MKKVSNKKVPVSGGMNKNLVIGVVVVVLLLVGVFWYFNNQKEVGLSPDPETIQMKLNKGWNLVSLPFAWELFDTENEKELYDKGILAAFVYYKKIEEYIRLHPFRETEKVNAWYQDAANFKKPSVISGDAVALFSGKTKLYVNDDLNKVKKVLTKSDLSTVLGDETFNGNIDTSMTQKIVIGSNPKVTFKKQPTSKDDPDYSLTTSTTQSNYIYSATVSFSKRGIDNKKAVNFSHPDSEGEDIELFGTTFTVGAATDFDTLVLLEHGEKLGLDNLNSKKKIRFKGSDYTIEFISASDVSAIVKVTRDSTGDSEYREIKEAESEIVLGVPIAVVSADETNIRLSAIIVVGRRLIFEDGNSVIIDSKSKSLVIPEGSKKIVLDYSGGSKVNPKKIRFKGLDYTLELISASDVSATVKVTRDSTGDSEYKEIKEAESEIVLGVPIAVAIVGETNLRLWALIFVGADKLIYKETGFDSIIDGTLVDFESGVVTFKKQTVGAATKLTISVYAPEADEDAIKPGESFIDPVFGTFKLDFAGFNIDTDDEDSREDIKFKANGDDKMDITFTDHRGYAKTFQFVKNTTTKLLLMGDDSHRNISVLEKEKIQYQEYVVVGNEDEGYYLQLSAVKNASSGTSSDKAEFKDIFTGDIYKTSWTSDGAGTIDIGGKSYDVVLEGVHTDGTEVFNVTLGYPDSSGAGVAVIYPTIETSLGAKIMFYEPKTINVSSWDGDGTALTTLRFPDGDGYMDVDVSNLGDIEVGELVFNLRKKADNLLINLRSVKGDIISQPAVIIFEEKDDNSNYEAIIVELEAGATIDDGLGIDTVEDTWSDGSIEWSSSRYSDSKLTDRGDLWGSIITIDSADSDQKTATISYPDEQIYAQIYMAEEFTKDFSNIDAATLYSSMWIYSNKKQTLKLGRITELRKELEKLVINDVILPKGWNFGSITKKMIDRVWYRMKGDCNTQKPGFVSWDSENQKWEVRSKEYLKNTAFKDSELYSGFVINMAKKCNLGMQIPEAPALPKI